MTIIALNALAEREMPVGIRPEWVQRGYGEFPNRSYLSDTGRCASKDRIEKICGPRKSAVFQFIDDVLNVPPAHSMAGQVSGRRDQLDQRRLHWSYDRTINYRDDVVKYRDDMNSMMFQTIEGIGWHYFDEGLHTAEGKVAPLQSIARAKGVIAAGTSGSVDLSPPEKPVSEPNQPKADADAARAPGATQPEMTGSAGVASASSVSAGASRAEPAPAPGPAAAPPRPRFEVKYGTRADLPRHSGAAWINTPIVNSELLLDFGLPGDVSLGLPHPRLEERFHLKGVIIDGEETGERYAMSVARRLPIWELDSRLLFRGTSNRLTASLTKQLTPEVSCVLDSNRTVDFAASKLLPGEERIKLTYTVAF